MSIQMTRVKGNPDRQLNSRANVVDALLAVGTHVFSINPSYGAVFAIVDNLALTGTANVEFTADDRPFADIQSGTAPAQTLNADVAKAAWFPAASTGAASGLSGRVTAVQITVATSAVHVQIVQRDRSLGMSGA